MNAADLDALWRGIEPSTVGGSLAGRSVPDLDHAQGVLLAVDNTGRRHVLIPAEADSPQPRQPVSKGLAIGIDELRVGDRPARHYVDIACRDAAMHANFTAVAAEIVDALGDADGDVVGMLEAILARWKWFWGVPPDGLTEDEAMGLFGELWFLEFWLSPVDAAVLEAWTGPSGDRHDFKWVAASVEIKSTRVRSDGAAKHRISNLDQLAPPEQGQLYLFSLRAIVDPIGTHSLRGSIDRIRGRLSSRPELLHAFDGRLASAGYTPAGDRYDRGIRIVAEELYRVTEGFPRLDRNSFQEGVPNGIDGIAYTLDLVACEPWRMATAPGAESRELRATLT